MSVYRRCNGIILDAMLISIFILSSTFGQTLFPAQKDNLRWGYIDSTGKEVIPFKFHDVSFFSEGLGSVNELVKTDKNPDWNIEGVPYKNAAGYLDSKGNYVIKPDKRWRIGGDFKGGFAVVTIADGKGKTVILKNGSYLTNETFVDCDDYSEGFFAVKVKKKWGFLNRKGIVCIKPQFDEVGPFKEGLAFVKVKKMYGFIDTTGKMVCEPRFAYAASFENGYAKVACDSIDRKKEITYTDELKKWRFLDKATMKLLPFTFDDKQSCYAEKDYFCGNSNSRGIAFNAKGDTLYTLKSVTLSLKKQKYNEYTPDEYFVDTYTYSFKYPFVNGYAVVEMVLPSPYSNINAIADKKGEIVREGDSLVPGASSLDFVYSKTIRHCDAYGTIPVDESQYLVLDQGQDVTTCWVINGDGTPLCSVAIGKNDYLSSVYHGLVCLKSPFGGMSYYNTEGKRVWSSVPAGAEHQ